MKQRRLTVLAIATIAITLALTDVVRGNGQQFFPAANGKAVNLVYFGRLKDKSTGRLIRNRAFLTIFDNGSGMSFPFTNDSVAHYRSPDVGAAVKELGGVKIDPKNLEIQLMVAGYRDIRLTTLPRANHGAVELNFVMEPTGTGAGQPGTSDTPTESQSSNLPVQSPWAQPMAYGSVGLFMVAVTVRTLGRRRSTGD
jgi:hypothetical protein